MKFLNKQIWIIAFSFSMFFLFSCEENNINEPDLQIDTKLFPVSTYFLDGNEIKAEDIDLSNEDLNIIYLALPLKIELHAFKSKEDYISFGEKYGLKLRESIVFEEMISSIAEKKGIIDMYEKTNKLPDWWDDYEKALLDSIFNYSTDDYIDTDKSVWVTLFKQSFGGPSSIMLRTLPAMWPGWNNSVSRVEFFGVGGGLIIYDRTFYRRRLATYVNWGMTTIQLPTGVENKMSSGIKLF